MAITDNLVYSWRLTANSSEVFGNTGADTDITYDGFANFDGNSSKIALTTAIARPTNLTVSAWIKATTGANMWIIADINADDSEGWGFGVRSDGKLRIMWKETPSGESGFWDTDNVVIADANLHFVAVTQVAIDGTPVIYVDGVSKPLTKVFGSGTTAPSAQGTAIGEYGAYTGGLQWFNGAINNLNIWSRAITSGEVTTLYNSGNNLLYPFITGNPELLNNIVSYWKLDGDSTDIVNAKNGTDTDIVYYGITRGLVSYWKMDANSTDFFGANDGSDTAMSYSSAGIKGNCATYNGTTSIMKVTGLETGAIPTNCSISAWFKTTNSSDGLYFLGWGGAVDFRLNGVNSGANMQLTLRDSDNVRTDINSSGITCNDGNWHHVVGIKSGSSTYLYLDNVYQGTQSATFTGNFNVNNFYIGSTGVVQSIDEMGYYNVALTATEVGYLYNFATGKINQGAGFNGTTSKIDLGNIFGYTTSFSTGGWFKSSTTGINQPLINKSNTTGSNYYWTLLGANTSNYPLFILWNTVAGGYLDVTGNVNVCDGNWHYITGVYDSAVPSLKLYIDGSLNATDTTTSGTWNTGATTNATIGAYADGVNFTNGAIDEVGIWSRALTATEVKQLYNFNNGLPYPLRASLSSPFPMFLLS